ncbi:MAG TPA: hemerythrin domain-containing protein [Solirubrobacterales bacterium]|nr:hemerythrin domain-containing protein [Solirubrobacterales bacterium]
MKRTAELTPLSHDHHQALFVAMGLKRAEGPEAATAYLDYHESTGARHFEVEETVLLPGWLAADPGAEVADAHRILAEHLEIRTATARLRSGELSVAELRALGELLARHVRFEERELFPRIEERLDEPTLQRLGAAIAAAEAAG